MDPALAAMLDREAISMVVHRLARAIDRIDDPLLLSCYWPEAIDDHSHFVGDPAGFAAYAAGVTRATLACHHHITTQTIELAGDDAYVESYFLFTARFAAPPHFLSNGRYVDHFHKRGGEWRILSRVTVVEANFGLAETEVGADVTAPYGPGERFPGTRDGSDVSYARPPVPRRPRSTD